MARSTRPRTTDDPRDREIIVTERRRGGVGAVIATVIGILAVLFIGYLLFAGGFEDGVEGEPSVEIPSEVDVDVDAGSAG